MNYSQKPPEGPTPSDEWLSYHEPSQADDCPNLPDALHVPPEQAEQEPFNPADFIVSVTTAEPLSPEENETKRQYITTHTPHAWLDRYTSYSRELSPRGFNALHEMAGLWAMSSAVAGRAIIAFGGRIRHTSLMFAAVARSSVWVKSHTIGVAEKVLTDAGLDWRLLPTKATPQAIIEEMANSKAIIKLQKEINEAEDEAMVKGQQRQLEGVKQELGLLYAHEGQRAWYISEFGSKIIAGMMRPGSVMADFSDFLRDVNEKVGKDFVYRTRGHGRETISNPYLAIIADTTPADIRPYAKVGAPLWSNGFFPRFALIAPTSEEIPSKARVAYEYCKQLAAPYELTKPLSEINKRLGKRRDYDDALKKVRITYSRDIWNAIYEYEAWIGQNRLETEDLDGTYARLCFEQSVAIAMLLAIFDDSHEIKPHHYQRAKEVTERIRRCTEDFYLRMTKNPISEKQAAQSQLEDRVIRITRRHREKKGEWPTVSDIRTRSGRSKDHRLPREDILKVMQTLKDAGSIEEFKEDSKRAFRYRVLS